MGILKTLKSMLIIDDSLDDEQTATDNPKECKAPDSHNEKDSRRKQFSTCMDSTVPNPLEIKFKEQKPAAQKEIRPSFSTQNAFKMIVIEPKEFNAALKLVDNLKSNKAVVVNLESVETELAKKIFYFLSGAIYALAGNVQKITNNVFVFCPQTITIRDSVTYSSFS